MQRQNYMITAEEVAESMGISLGYAYKLLRKLNKELADQGCRKTFSGAEQPLQTSMKAVGMRMAEARPLQIS